MYNRKNKWMKSFVETTVESGPRTQSVYFRAIGAVATHGCWYAWVEDVWVSAGASYGPQVEFSSEAEADAFVEANPDCFRSSGTTRPRVNVPSVELFVKAFEASRDRAFKVIRRKAEAPKVAEKVEEPKAVQAETTALIDVELDEDAEIAKLKAAIAAKKAAKAAKAAKDAEIAKLKAELAALDEE